MDGSRYYYRVKAYGAVAESEYSAPITVDPIVKPGSISFVGIVCAGDVPGQIDGTPASGGTGAYEYRWQFFNGTTWIPLVTGAGFQNYATSQPLNSDTQIRRQVRSNGGEWFDSDPITLTAYNVITDIGTLSATGETICPEEYLEFTYAPAAGVNTDGTHLIGVKGASEIDFGQISDTKSINVQEGYSYFVRYDQPCTTTDYETNQVSFSFYTNCNIPPSMDQNFVRTEVPLVPVSSEYELSILNTDDKATSYAYSDGLGRPSVSIAVQAGSNYEDVIQFSEYDDEGREEYSYLPYMEVKPVPGEYLEPGTAKTEQLSFYDPATSAHADIGHDTKPYSKTEWDARGRVKSVIAPGVAWHSGDKKTSYYYDVFNPSQFTGNASSIHAPVIKWEVHNGLPRHYVNNSNIETYGAKELSISLVTDVEGRQSRSLTDTRGLAITSQVFDEDQNKWVGSYNVYDDFGRVVFMIPPRLAEIAAPTQAQVDELAFQYVYDDKGRVIQERAPGAGWVEYVYDHWNRLVLTRHAAQVKNCDNDGENCDNYWTYYKYDALNREIMSGEILDDRNRETLSDFVGAIQTDNLRFEVWDGINAEGYSNDTAFPKSSDYAGADQMIIYTVNYFDNYDFLNVAGWDAEGHDFGLTNPTGFDHFGWGPEGYTLLTEDLLIEDNRQTLPGEDPPTGDYEHNGKYAKRPGVTITFASGAVAGPEFDEVAADMPYTAIIGGSTGSKVKILGTNT
ncbi:DUF6443 domain-containing protein [Ekhidna sp.]